MPGILWASIVLPSPGGPIIRMLWEPAAAISIALFACWFPLTSEKSGWLLTFEFVLGLIFISQGESSILPFKKLTSWFNVSIAIIFRPFNIVASLILPTGAIKILFSSMLIARGNMPFIGLTVPSRDNSPHITMSLRFSWQSIPFAVNIPTAIAKSKQAPSFLISAGARLTVILLELRLKWEFLIADITLFADSLQAVSGNPTIEKPGVPPEISISTSTLYPLIPCVVLDSTFANIFISPPVLTQIYFV